MSWVAVTTNTVNATNMMIEYGGTKNTLLDTMPTRLIWKCVAISDADVAFIQNSDELIAMTYFEV